MFPAKPFATGVWSAVRLTRLGFGIWFLWRRFVVALQGRRRRTLAFDAHTVKVVDHNANQAWRITRQRTERLLNVMRSIRRIDPRRARVLIIGPRNEAEILLFEAYGFVAQNIEAIDLFSVSPWIKEMDMHDLRYPADSFDIVYASYVLTYSDRLQTAVDQMIGVTKPGGLLALSWGIDTKGETNVVGTRSLRGMLGEVRDLIGDRLEHVYWQEAHPNGTVYGCSYIAAIAKTPVVTKP
jgi:SAM-dependent methyltransferase